MIYSSEQASTMGSKFHLIILFAVIITIVRAQNDRPQSVKVCPAFLSGSCTDECTDDSACRGATKCCRTACGGRVCSVTISSTVVNRRPEQAPVLSSSQGALDAANSPGSKPGTCTPNLTQYSSCSSRCHKDTDCRYDLKCCRTTCGGRICSAPRGLGGTGSAVVTTTTRRPAGQRYGECPNTSLRRPSDAAQGAPCRNNCRTDTECVRSTYKCCQNSCGGKECVPAVISIG